MMRVGALVALVCGSTLLVHDHGAHAAVWHVPLERHHDARPKAEAFASARRLAATSNHASVWDPNTAQLNVAAQGTEDVAADHDPLPVDFRDILMNMFAAKVSIGTPPQEMSLLLDLVGSDFMVLSQPLNNHLYYNHSKSTTYQANGTQVKMFEGFPFETDGFVSKDHVALGGAHSAGRIEVSDLPFVELTGTKSTLGSFPAKMDGYIGIGPGRANSTGAPSIVRSMIDQQLLDRPQVGLRYEEVIAHAVFGGVEAAHSHDDFHYYTQQHSGEWSAPVRTIVVGGKAVLKDVGRINILDIDGIIGPADLVDALADAVGAENYALPCDGPGPNITFQLADGFPVTLTKNDYAIPQDQGWCMFGMYPWSRPTWVVGLPFLRNVYTVLDYGASESERRIGFAPIKP